MVQDLHRLWELDPEQKPQPTFPPLLLLTAGNDPAPDLHSLLLLGEMKHSPNRLWQTWAQRCSFLHKCICKQFRALGTTQPVPRLGWWHRTAAPPGMILFLHVALCPLTRFPNRRKWFCHCLHWLNEVSVLRRNFEFSFRLHVEASPLGSEKPGEKIGQTWVWVDT